MAKIIWKTDRLTRNLRDLLMLMEDVFRDHNVQFVSSTESIDITTPAGRLALNMLAAVGGRSAAKNTYVLSGLVRCGVCGSNMVICNAGRNRDGSYWRAYRCKNKCVKGIEYKKLESCVFDYLSEHAGSDDFRTTLLTLAAEFNACAAEAPGDDAETARLAIAQKELERANLFRLAAMSANPPASLLDEIAQRDEEIAQLQRDLESAQKSAPRIDEAALLDRLNTLIHIKEMPAQKQKAAVKEVVDAVTIFPDSIEISITTTASGGAEPLPAVFVAALTLTISASYIQRHKLPPRFLRP